MIALYEKEKHRIKQAVKNNKILNAVGLRDLSILIKNEIRTKAIPANTPINILGRNKL